VGEPRNHNGFRKSIGLLATGVLVVHIGLCAYFFVKRSGALNRTLPGVFYRNLVLAGPFFEESVIQTSDRLYYRYKLTGEGWTTFRENSESTFNAYNGLPWRYGEFMRGDYIRRQAYALERYGEHHAIDPVRAPGPLQKIDHYIRYHAGDVDIDSITIVSVRDRYDIPTARIHADTLYSLTYSPRQLEEHR